ncbi:hypothetical protein OAO72_00160 [Alphaproteobacteria bacterium]|nr:hypothetical protein [Alphaproteobacteria bacterium]
MLSEELIEGATARETTNCNTNEIEIVKSVFDGYDFHMFGNKPSKDAVRRAITRLREYDDCQFELFEMFPPRLAPSYAESAGEKDTILDKEFRQDNQKKNDFNMGVVSALLDFFLDGDEKYREKFYKEVIVSAFNFGFLANFGKKTYQGFLRVRNNPNPLTDAGEFWAKKYYIPEVVAEGVDVKTKYATLDYEENKYYSGEYSEKSALRAGVTIKEHKKWCSDQIDQFEEIYEYGSSKDFLSHIRALDKKSLNDKKESLIEDYAGYEEECKYLGREPIPELLQDWMSYLYESSKEIYYSKDKQSEIMKRIAELEDGLVHSRIEIQEIINEEFGVEVKRIRNKWRVQPS